MEKKVQKSFTSIFITPVLVVLLGLDLVRTSAAIEVYVRN